MTAVCLQFEHTCVRKPDMDHVLQIRTCKVVRHSSAQWGKMPKKVLKIIICLESHHVLPWKLTKFFT